MRFPKRFLESVIATACVVAIGPALVGQTSGQGQVQLPKNAVALEGKPLVRIDATEDQITRRPLTETEMTENHLTIKTENGRYFWASRGNLPLTLSSSGDFTYLASSEPGKYVRFRRVNDRITYVEHVDMAHGSVTYWGELKIVLGR
jgi:hypothetical protein